MPISFLIPIIIAFDLLVAATIISLLFRSSWKPLEIHFPAQTPSETSYGRKFQSFSIGLVSYGFSIHVVIDDQYLHLSPAWIASRFGLRPISIPWEAIQPLSPTLPIGNTAKVLVRKQTITGPKWCLELLYNSPQTPVQQ